MCDVGYLVRQRAHPRLSPTYHRHIVLLIRKMWQCIDIQGRAVNYWFSLQPIHPSSSVPCTTVDKYSVQPYLAPRSCDSSGLDFSPLLVFMQPQIGPSTTYTATLLLELYPYTTAVPTQHGVLGPLVQHVV